MTPVLDAGRVHHHKVPLLQYLAGREINLRKLKNLIEDSFRTSVNTAANAIKNFCAGFALSEVLEEKVLTLAA